MGFKAIFLASLHISHCIPDPVSGEWYNSHCDDPRGFVCKRNPGNTGTVTDRPTPAVGGSCPANYIGVGRFKLGFIFNYGTGHVDIFTFVHLKKT